MIRKDPYPWSLAKPVIFDDILILIAVIMLLFAFALCFYGNKTETDVVGTAAAILSIWLKHRHDAFFSRSPIQYALLDGSFEGLKGLTLLAKIRSYVASRLFLIHVFVAIVFLLNRVLIV